MTGPPEQLEADAIAERAHLIASAGGLSGALDRGLLSPVATLSLAEALILGLLKQGVRKYLAIFGHGNTALGEVLRIYEAAGVTRAYQFRNEVAMAHAATQLSWQYGEVAAVLTSIGPGALHAFAGSLAAASNGIGVYHIYGDETTWGEGYNMQQVPKPRQAAYATLTNVMGRSYTLHTPEALREALRQGAVTVHHPTRAGPFYLLTPINTQPQMVRLNLSTLPDIPRFAPVAPATTAPFVEAADRLDSHDRIVIKVGGGGRRFAGQISAFAGRVGAAVVLSPGSTGVLPDGHPQNMHVGGSKGTISGNHAMAEATLLVAIGTRAVCQSDCSGIGYPRAQAVINVNANLDDATHYARTTALIGDIGAVLDRLTDELGRRPAVMSEAKRIFLAECLAKKREWAAFKAGRFAAVAPPDPVWGRRVMTQPQAIKTVCDFAKAVGAVKLFDAGDVQANGFQIVEDDRPFETFTETGASYMGYAVSALMASAIADAPSRTIALTGDGSFMMNPQILVDAVEHGLCATIVIFDNRGMGAIAGLQLAQYGAVFRTSGSVVIDYLRLASSVNGVRALDGGATPESLDLALSQAHAYNGLSVIHVPVYGGADPVGGMGVYGAWNVGSWCAAVQAHYAEQSI